MWKQETLKVLVFFLCLLAGVAAVIAQWSSEGQEKCSLRSILLLSTYSDSLAYCTIYMLEFFHFNLMLGNLLHVAIVKYSTWA